METTYTRARVIAGLKVPLFTAHEWPCADCGGRLILIAQNNQPIYQCENAFRGGCQGTASAHVDGTPMGIPINAEGRMMRRLLHSILDKYWMSYPDKKAARQKVYAHMHSRIGDIEIITPNGKSILIQDFHISYLMHDDLRKAMQIAQNELPKLF